MVQSRTGTSFAQGLQYKVVLERALRELRNTQYYWDVLDASSVIQSSAGTNTLRKLCGTKQSCDVLCASFVVQVVLGRVLRKLCSTEYSV